MRNIFSKFALTAALMLAITFTLSCGDHSLDNLLGNNSSSSVSERRFDYCITASGFCLPGSYTVAECNGTVSNSCPSNPGGSSPSVGGSSSSIAGGGNGAFTAIADMKTWLASQPDNTPSTPYTVKLNVSNFGGSATATGSVGRALRDNPTKYVILDLSGSTFASIVGSAFGSPNSANERALTLVGIIIPSTVTSIENNAFYGCTSLSSIIIPNSVTSIGDRAFKESGLQDVTIGSGVTSIGNNAFESCKGLISVTIPSSVTSIGASAFSGCTSLTSVNFAANSRITIIGSSAFNGCKSLTSVIIPNSVTSIGGSAFSGCASLASVTIGSSVTSIESNAFYGCTSLATVRFEGSAVATFGYTSFINSTATTNLQNAYKAGGAGTYTRSANTWTKDN